MPVVTLTIAAGASLSNALDVTGANLSIRKIIFPAAWSVSMPLTFQCSLDNVTYYDLYFATGQLVSVQVNPNSIVLPDRAIWGGGWFKFRAGVPPSGTIQPQARSFTCVVY